jgi:hypothetical protein
MMVSVDTIIALAPADIGLGADRARARRALVACDARLRAATLPEGLPSNRVSRRPDLGL